MDRDVLRKRFEASCERAHAVSGDRPEALSRVEEDILHLEAEEDRSYAQQLLARSQDAFQMRLPRYARSFTWVGCLRFTTSWRFDGVLASEFIGLLDAAVADLSNPRVVSLGHAAPFLLVPHGLTRCGAETRTWLSFHACANVVGEARNEFSIEGLVYESRREGLHQFGIFAALPDATLRESQLQQTNLPIGTLPAHVSLRTRIESAVSSWVQAHPDRAIELDHQWMRMSDAVEEAEFRATCATIQQVLGPGPDSKAVTPKLFPAMDVAIGALRTGEPYPSQAAMVNLCVPDEGRIIRVAGVDLLCGTPLLKVLEATRLVLSRNGIAIAKAVVLPPIKPVRRLTVDSAKVPCIDGKYRETGHAYFGKPAWRFKRFDWSEGWKYGGPPFGLPAARPLVSMPHPIALELAGAGDALTAHFEPELFSELQEQLRVPGRCSTAGEGQLRIKDPSLHDLQGGEDGDPHAPPEDPLEVPPGLYCATHWKAASGVMMIARETLVVRLQQTSIEKGFSLSYLRLPFPDVYVHFEKPVTRRRPDGTMFSLTGFYASEEQSETLQCTDPEVVRWVNITFTYTYDDEVVRIGGLSSPYPIRSDEKRDMVSMIAEMTKKFASDLSASIGTEDLAESIFAEECNLLAAQIILYTTLKSARMEAVNDRSKLLTEISGTTGSKREKISQKLKRAFDYILVGPDTHSEDSQLSQMHHHGVKPHWRKGFYRDQAWGERWSLRKQVWIAPVLVNARDIGDDTPPRKPYILE